MRFLVVAVGLATCAILLAPDPGASHFKRGRHNTLHAIDKAFCGHYRGCRAGTTAKRIAWCETGGTYSPWASNNGVYLGIFQFGPYARSTYGFSWSSWEQARAAARMWRAEGWRPWECAYLLGVLG